MNARTANLKQLVAESGYPIDEAAIAEALVMRSMVRSVIPEVAFRVESSEPRVRSFRPYRAARSFRLARAAARLSPPGQLAHVA